MVWLIKEVGVEGKKKKGRAGTYRIQVVVQRITLCFLGHSLADFQSSELMLLRYFV